MATAPSIPTPASAVPAAEKHMLFQSYIDDSQPNSGLMFKILPGQTEFEDRLQCTLEELNMTLDFTSATRRPCGTIFITHDVTFRTPSDMHVESFKPLIFEGSSLPIMGGLDDLMISQIDYLLRYMHQSEDPEFGPQLAGVLADQYSAYGYEVDWSRLLAQAPEEDQAPEGSLLAQLLAQYPCPDEEETGFYVDPKTWKVLIRNRAKKRNTLLTGPTGSGKTELSAILTKVFGEDLHIQDMGTIQDVQSSLIGVHRLDHQGHSIFDPAPMVHYIQSGATVLLDEINRAPLSANNVLFPCLDSRRYLPVDIAGEGEERHIKMHEETFMIGTANLGAEYGGTQSLDKAFKNRFHIIELPYMRPDDEVRILKKRTGIDEKQARTIVNLANFTRTETQNQDLSEALSTRETLAIAEMVMDGFDLLEAIESVAYPIYENDGIDSERSKVIAAVAQF